jgi:hypothetical protein
MTDETEELAVQVVETAPRRDGTDLEVATQGWGWPAHDSPDSAAHESFMDAMDTIRKQVALDANIGEVVATLIVDIETRHVRDWALESNVKEGR